MSARLSTAHQQYKTIGTEKYIFIVLEEALFDIKVVGRFQHAVQQDCTAEFSSTFGPANIYLRRSARLSTAHQHHKTIATAPKQIFANQIKV